MLIVHHEIGAGGWTSAVAPDDDERRRLTSEHGVPEEFISHSLDQDERPRVQHSGDAMMIVLRIPVARGWERSIPYETIPLGLVLLPDRIVTICAEDDAVLSRLRRFAETEWTPEARHRLVLHALQVIAQAYLAHLDAIDKRVDELEERLSASLENREVIGLLRIQKSLAHFTAALRGTELVIAQLLESSPEEIHIPAEDQPLLEEALIEFRQAIETTNLSGEILAQMMDAFASIISNNVNLVVKRLTAITFILTFPVVIASFWGMNVPMPGGRHPFALWLLMALSAAISAAIAFAFRRWRWL